jgi:hypothetical protein
MDYNNKETKLTVTHPAYGTFTRTTARKYQYALLTTGMRRDYLAACAVEAEEFDRRELARYQHVLKTGNFERGNTREDYEKYVASKANRLSNAPYSIDESALDAAQALSWHSSLKLANKALMARAQRGWDNLMIVPVLNA